MKMNTRKSLLVLFSFFILINLSLNKGTQNDDEDLIDISKGYTHVNPSDRTYFYIAILSTSDIHGHFYPEEYEINGTSYSQGGFDYLAKYINILNLEFPNRVLYLDAGDLFQGSIESIISDGEIMTESLNLVKCQGATFGEHEFDYTREFLEDKISKSQFPYLATNIYDNKKETKKAFGDNHFTSKIYSFNVTNSFMSSNNLVDQVKIGVIGLSKALKKNEISGKGFDDITFLSYRNELVEESKKLREEGCHAVILLSHIGLKCGTYDKVMKLNMYAPKTEQELCDSQTELYQLIKSIDKEILDGIITGQSHQEAHHWINEIPVMSTVDKGFYANIMYIPFKWSSAKQIYELYKSKVQIEGPIPICEKIFEKTGKCEYVGPNEIGDYLPLVEYKFHGIKVENDKSLLGPVHEKYDEKYEEYREKVCDIIGTEEKLIVSDDGDNYIGNIITDIQSRITGADISITSIDNLKTSWNPGKLPKYKISDLMPVKSDLCTFVMNGNEVKKMMSILQTGKNKYYPTCGIKQTMSRNENNEYYLSDLKLFDGYQENEIIPEQEYTISTIKNLIGNGGSDFDKILSWYKPRELNCEYGDFGDLVEKYLKAQKTVDVRKYKDENNPKIKFIN